MEGGEAPGAGKQGKGGRICTRVRGGAGEVFAAQTKGRLPVLCTKTPSGQWGPCPSFQGLGLAGERLCLLYAGWTAGSGSLIVMRLALPPATWPAQDNSQERKHESESETSKAGQRLGSGRRVLAPALSSGSRLLQALPAHHTLARCHHLHRMPAKQWVGPRSPCVHWVCRDACRSGGAGLSTAPGTASQASPPALPGSGRPDVSLTCSFRKNRVSPVQQRRLTRRGFLV